MFEKTSAIVLHVTKYSDTTSIVHLYTERFGRINCLVSGMHRKKSANKVALFAPMSVLDVDVSNHQSSDMQRIYESRLLYTTQSIPYNENKRAVSFFMAEVLYRTLKQPIESEDLFAFIVSSVQELDKLPMVANFSLVFLLQLSLYIGFYPNMEGKGDYFNMESGEKCTEQPLHPNFLMPDECVLLSKICAANYATVQDINLSRVQRTNLLDALVKYYTLHVPEFYGLKSLEVLAELFD